LFALHGAKVVILDLYADEAHAAAQSIGVQHMGLSCNVSRSNFAPLRARCLDAIACIAPKTCVCDFGHLGDGGIHLNLVVADDTPLDCIEALRETIYDITVREFSGSFSAENGVEPSNARFYERFVDAPTRSVVRLLRERVDPGGLLGNAKLA